MYGQIMECLEYKGWRMKILHEDDISIRLSEG